MNGFLLLNRVIYEVVNRLSNKHGLEEMNMKIIMTGIAAMTLVISVCSTTAFAAGGCRGRNCVDGKNDGVCDYYSTSCQFVDNDGDGICDNYTAGTPQNGSGYRRGHCGGQGRRCR